MILVKGVMMNSFFMILRLTIIAVVCNLEGVLQAQILQPEIRSPVTLSLEPAARAQSTLTPTPPIKSIPSVIISSPVANQRFELDRPAIVVARAVDPQGVMRVE